MLETFPNSRISAKRRNSLSEKFENIKKEIYTHEKNFIRNMRNARRRIYLCRFRLFDEDRL